MIPLHVQLPMRLHHIDQQPRAVHQLATETRQERGGGRVTAILPPTIIHGSLATEILCSKHTQNIGDRIKANALPFFARCRSIKRFYLGRGVT